MVDSPLLLVCLARDRGRGELESFIKASAKVREGNFLYLAPRYPFTCSSHFALQKEKSNKKWYPIPIFLINYLDEKKWVISLPGIVDSHFSSFCNCIEIHGSNHTRQDRNTNTSHQMHVYSVLSNNSCSPTHSIPVKRREKNERWQNSWFGYTDNLYTKNFGIRESPE